MLVLTRAKLEGFYVTGPATVVLLPESRPGLMRLGIEAAKAVNLTSFELPHPGQDRGLADEVREIHQALGLAAGPGELATIRAAPTPPPGPPPHPRRL